MAASTIIKHLTDGSLDISDGTTPTPVSLSIPFTIGDFSLSGLSKDQTDVKAYKPRGSLQSIRQGEDTEPTGSFSCQVADYSDGTDGTVFDFVMGAGSYSGNASTSADIGDVYTCDLVWTVEGTDLGDAADHTLTLTDCHIVMDVGEGEPNTLSFSFTCYGTVTAT